MNTVLVLNNDQMGHGDPELGARILKTFLQKVRALRGLDALLLYNSGVRLVAPGSPVLAELVFLDEHGVDLLPCVTCLSHYAIEPAVGAASSMGEILDAMNAAEKVITL